MREVLHAFGERNHLQGIATLPEVAKRKIAIVLLNAGSVHKVGPFDLNRDLARRLVNEGYRVLRFDFGGIGDSRRLKSGARRHEIILREMTDALDVLQKHYGESRIVTIGLCTGAENGYRLALADERVVGNVWLDGYGYKNLKGTLLRYKLKFGHTRGLWKRIMGKLDRSLAENPTDLVDEDEWQWTLPPKEELSAGLNGLHERGVRILSIYSGGVASYNTYRDQFRDSFPGASFLASMDFEYYPKADHTYKIRKDRDIMLNRVHDWLKRTYV